jgi:hypothetical protein
LSPGASMPGTVQPARKTQVPTITSTASLKATRGDGSQKVTLFGKVLVRRIVTDAGAPLDLSQREGPILHLFEQRQRRLDKRRGAQPVRHLDLSDALFSGHKCRAPLKKH